MDSVARLSCKQQPLAVPLHHHRTSFSGTPICSISFRTQLSSSHPSVSFKIRASSSADYLSLSSNAKSPKTQNSFSLFSSLKTPLCVAVAATALFFSSLGCRPLLAIATPAPTVEFSPDTAAAEEAVSDEEREKSLEEHVASHPDDFEALRSLMEIKIKNRKLPEAVEVINRMIALEPDEFELPLLRAHMYSYLGESELAKARFEEILEKDPLRVEAYHGLVMAAKRGETSGKELEEVLKRIQEALEKCKREKKKEDVRDFKLLIAQVCVIEGNYNEALKLYQELVKEEPRDFRPYLCQGIIYTLLRKKDEAEKQFEKYKRLVPKGHPYARYFDENMLATKVFSQMAENERTKTKN